MAKPDGLTIATTCLFCWHFQSFNPERDRLEGLKCGHCGEEIFPKWPKDFYSIVEVRELTEDEAHNLRPKR